MVECNREEFNLCTYAIRHSLFFDTLFLRKAHRKLHSYCLYIHHNLDQAETVDVRPFSSKAVQEQDGKFSSSSREQGLSPSSDQI